MGQSRRKSEHDDEAKDVQVPESDADTVVAAIDNARSSSFSALSAAGSAEAAAYARQLSSDNLAAMAEAPAPAPASTDKPAELKALADPPELELQLSETDLAVRDAQQLNDDFEWSEARRVLLPFAESDESHARCALAVCTLHLAEAASEAKESALARDLAVEALSHATAAVESDPASAMARIWFGQALQVRAKVVDGGLGQARVCGQAVQSWEMASELAPSDPLAYHLLGSFAFHITSLPWLAQRTLRALAPGLRKFTSDDALRFLLRSEECRTEGAPCQHHALTNASMIGRIYAQQGRSGKADARQWLERALQLEPSLPRLDKTAREAAAAARKAIAAL